MAQCRVHYRTYNHADNQTVAADLVFCDAAGTEVAHKKAEGPEGAVIATFADVGDATALRVKCASDEWRLVRDPCYVPCVKDCKFEIALQRPEREPVRMIEDDRCVDLSLELEWCETVDGRHQNYGHASAAALNLRDGDGDWKETKPALHGKARFHVPRGKWYTLDAPGVTMCPGPPWIFACGEQELCVKVCCRPAHLLELIFEDQCGQKLAHTECLLDGRRARANEHGRLWHVCTSDAAVSVQPRGDHWTFAPVSIDVSGGQRKTQAILCSRVPAPAKATWIVLDVQIEDPEGVFAYLEPVGDARGAQPVILSLDPAGHAEKDFGQAANFMLRLIDKTTGQAVYTDVLQTEVPPTSAVPAPALAAHIAAPSKASAAGV